MKTAILQCLQQFSSKNSKNVYHDQFLKKVKLQWLCKIVQNVRFNLYITRFMKLLFCSVCSGFPVKTAKTFIMTNF